MKTTMVQQIFDQKVFQALMPQLFEALGTTLLLSFLSILCGFLLGCLGGYGLQSKNKAANRIANIYIWIFRCTPLLVQALYVYFVFPELLHIDLSSNVCAVIVLSLISGAYMSNIVASALGQIDKGIEEAGTALGLSYGQVLWHIIIPQAFQSMIPSLFNQFVICVKDTAVLSVINVNEMTHVTKTYASVTFKNIASYTLLALFYWCIVNVLLCFQKPLEKYFNRGRRIIGKDMV